MARELYHFHFQKPHFSRRFALITIGGTALLLLIILSIIQYVLPTKYNLFIIFFEYALPAIIILGLFGYLSLRVRGGIFDENEFILYDNGWFVFWDLKFQDWIAPAKIDWLYPPELVLKPLKGSNNGYYSVRKSKNGMYYIVFRLTWGYQYGKWKCWIFYDKVDGWITGEEYKKLIELVNFLSKKAKENVKSGKIKPSEGNCTQAYVDLYQQPPYWNTVFEKANIRVLYKKETGEDLPEPVRSYLFDLKTYAQIYFENKKKTGDWFGMSEKK